MSFDPLDIARYFDPIDRIEGAISTFLNADWRVAWRRAGLLGVASEMMACLTARNAPTLRVRRGCGWNGQMVEGLLGCYGVKVWDRGASGEELYFCVKRRQAKWAEYVLLRAGVPVTSVLKESRNTGWAMRRLGIPIPQGWRKK